MKKTLYPHQEQGVEYIVNGGSLLFMEMRTGKTLTTIRGIKKLQKDKIYRCFPVLIVCPKSVAETWKNELHEDGVPDEQVQIVTGSIMKRTTQLRHPKWFNIVNYEMLETYDVLKRPWRFIVYDESIRLGNLSAKVTKYAVKKRIEGIRYLGLSGSPASESPIQLVSQYLAIKGDFMGYTVYGEYLNDHWKYVERAWKWRPKKKSHLQEIQDYTQQTAYCVTMKDLNLGSEKLYTVRDIEANKAQEDLFFRVRELTHYTSRDGEKMEYNALTRTTHEQLVASGIDPYTGMLINDAKIQDVLDYYRVYDEPILILSRFTSLIQHALKIFKKAKVKVDFIDGSVPVKSNTEKTREDKRVEFMEGRLDVVIGQVTTVKMGLDFSRATTIFYLSNSFSQDDRAQSEMRATHVDKKDPVQIVDSCTVGSMDHTVVELLKDKMEVSTEYIQQKMKEANNAR